jgi:tetratricopeptide (TPR) repeat protein
MGNALKDKGKLQEAIEAYNKAISIKPDYAEAYNNLGEAHREAANFEQAKICFEEALGINPKLNKLGLSLALQGLGRYEEAIQAVVWKVNKPTELQISWGKEV